MISGINWGSWNVSPLDKGELLYILWNSRKLPYPCSVTLDGYLIHWLSALYPR